MCKGSYKLVKTFTEGKAKTELGEDVFQATDDGSYFIAHEIGFSLGFGPTIWLRTDEIDSVIRVLYRAKELADERVTRFYSEDQAEVISPAMI